MDFAFEVLHCTPGEALARLDAAGDSIAEIQAFYSLKHKQRTKDRAAAQRQAEIPNRGKLPPPKRPGRR